MVLKLGAHMGWYIWILLPMIICPFICLLCPQLWKKLTGHIWIPHGKTAGCIFFLVWVISLSGVMPLRKNQNEILSARYLETYLSQGLETWSADRGYLINFWTNSVNFFWSYGPLKFWHFKLVSKLSRKLFKLGTWNLVSWLGIMSR